MEKVLLSHRGGHAPFPVPTTCTHTDNNKNFYLACVRRSSRRIVGNVVHLYIDHKPHRTPADYIPRAPPPLPAVLRMLSAVCGSPVPSAAVIRELVRWKVCMECLIIVTLYVRGVRVTSTLWGGGGASRVS